MKKLLFVFYFLSLLSCQQKNNQIKLPESVEKVSIIEFNGWTQYFEVINDSIVLESNFDPIIGVVEMDKDFNLKIIKKYIFDNKEYTYGETKASNHLRNIVIHTIDKFLSDSIDTEEKIRIYDGHYLFILIEKKNGDTILLSGSPDNISEETTKLSIFYEDSTEIYLNKKLENQDSLREYLKRYEKFRPEYMRDTQPLPPLPISKRSL